MLVVNWSVKEFAYIFLKHNLLKSKGHGIKTQVAWFRE